MNEKSYIRQKICELVLRFPKIKIAYQHNEMSDTHILEIKPVEVFDLNEAYQEFETNLTIEFDEKFFPHSILFISEDSLNSVTHPEFEAVGLMYEMVANISSQRSYHYNVEQRDYNTHDRKDYYIAA